ncbi:MAG TPA: glycosyltransferase [Phycisphaerae bacterium]|nr:glycosyltransferase [Phycisphaerae bacterium]
MQSVIAGLDAYSEGGLTDQQILEWLHAPARALIRRYRVQFDGVVEDILDRDVYRIQHHPGVKLGLELTWTEDPFDDRNWLVWFHSLAPISYLTQGWEMSGEARCLQRATVLVDSWIAAHIEEGRAHSMTWHDHAIALRALALLEFAEAWRAVHSEDVPFARRLLATLHHHGRLLMHPEIYRPGHNHGIEQDRALLSLALLVPQWSESEPWRHLGWSRLLEQIDAGISAEGVHYEHSPEYEGLVYMMLAQTRDFLLAHGHECDRLVRAVDSLQKKIAFSVRPDCKWPAVGDSVAHSTEELLTYFQTRPESSPETRYALTGGREGTAPASSHLILNGSGCGVFREHWHAETFDQALHCYFTSAFNTRTHKHLDDLSFSVFAFGREILADAGRYSYNYTDPRRQYCESVFGHNVVILNGTNTDIRRLNVGKSGITSSFSGKRVVGVDAVHYLYQGAETRRLLLYFAPNVIIAFDRILCDSPASTVQQFLFAPEWNVEPDSANPAHLLARVGDAPGDSPVVHMLQLMNETPPPRVVRGQDDPLIGWVSREHGKLEACCAVHTEVSSATPVFVTAFVFDASGQATTAPGGSAVWDGRELRCRLSGVSEPIEFTYSWSPGRARLFQRDAILESQVWPTPYEFRTRRSLAGRSSASARVRLSETSLLFAEAAKPEGGVADTLNAISAHVSKIEARQIETVEILNQDLVQLQRGLESVQAGFVDKLLHRIEELEHLRARSEANAEHLRVRLGSLEEAELELRERLSRLKIVAAGRAASIGKKKAALERLQQEKLDLREKLRWAREDQRLKHRRFMHAQEHLWDTLNSVRWRLGHALILALNPSLDTLKLPVRLMKLAREGMRRRSERALKGDTISETTALPAKSLPAAPMPRASRPHKPSQPRGDESAAASSRLFDRVRLRPTEIGPVRAPRREVRVACIFDEFSYECFAPEADLRQLTPRDWRRQMEEHRPALLFVESAWKGRDEAWRHLVSTDRRNGDGPLKDIVDHCRARGIPTVFWNKEDPANYEHFIKSAVWFDHILTTDSDCIDRYSKAAGHNRVGVLPFAAQPRIHNPVGRRGGELGDVCFAGTWYAAKHDGRKEDARLVLEPALAFGLHIYDRMFGYKGPGWQNYLYPPEYQGAIRGGLPYEEMLEAYKRYHVFLNVNSVRTSPTMCARRVFEILACGTNVVSAYAPSIENLLGPDCVHLARSAEETKQHLEALLGDDALRNRTSVGAIRRVMADHTYEHRFAELLSLVGMGAAAKRDRVLCVLSVANVEDYRAARAFLDAISEIPVEAVWLVAPEGPAIDAPGRVLRIVNGSAGAALSEVLEPSDADALFLWDSRLADSAVMLLDLYSALSYYGGDGACKPGSTPVDRLVFTSTTDAPRLQTLLRMPAAKKVGAAALVSDERFGEAVRLHELSILATDTVGVQPVPDGAIKITALSSSSPLQMSAGDDSGIGCPDTIISDCASEACFAPEPRTAASA